MGSPQCLSPVDMAQRDVCRVVRENIVRYSLRPADKDRAFTPMTRRKYEITARINEQDYPHIVGLALPPGGFRARSDAILTFHRERDIQIHRGQGRNDDGQFYVRYCSAIRHRPMHFCDQFGGERLNAKPRRRRQV
jgi:hypothetical protein